MGSRRDAFLRLLREPTLIAVLALIGLGASAVVWGLRMSTQVSQEMALENAAAYSAMLREFRTLYTSEVVVPTQGTLDARHDYREHADAIPLPATMTIALGERVALDNSGVEVHLYSEYPFPWREQSGGLRDDFRRAAWDALRANPDEPFYRIEQTGERSLLRYASADLLRPACVECHNTHPDTPRNDWKVGDVRGVLEVDYPMELVDERKSLELATLSVFALVSLLGFGILCVRLYRESVRVETTNLELGYQTRELTNLLDNMRQAVFMIDATHEIVAPVSQHAEVVIDGPLVGRSVEDILYRDLERGGESFGRIQQTLHILFGSDELQWTLAEQQLPRQLSYQPRQPGSRPRSLRVSHSPIWSTQGQLERILYVVEDVSDVDALERELEQERRTRDRRLGRINELASCTDFVHTVFEELLALLAHAEQLDTELASSAEARLELCRDLHTLKGSARTLGLSELSAAAHTAESAVEAFEEDPSVGIEGIRASLVELRARGAEYNELAHAVFNLELLIESRDPAVPETAPRPAKVRSPAAIQARLERLVDQLATEQGKRVEFVCAGLEHIDAPLAKPIEDALGHLLRNAIDHGLEAPSERRAAGKPERGRIELRCQRRAQAKLHIELEDDGRGVDTQALIAAALERGELSEDAAAELSHEDALALALRPRVSTREHATEVSGRGLGLEVVAAIAAQLGGEVELRSRLGAGSLFVIRLGVIGD